MKPATLNHTPPEIHPTIDNVIIEPFSFTWNTSNILGMQLNLSSMKEDEIIAFTSFYIGRFNIIVAFEKI